MTEFGLEVVLTVAVGLVTAGAGAVANVVRKVGQYAGREYNAVKNPSPLASLPGRPAANFFGGRYTERVLEEDVVLY